MSARAFSHASRLDELIRNSRSGDPVGVMTLPRADGGVITVLVSPTRSRDFARLDDLGMRDAATLLFVIDPAGNSGVPPRLVGDAFSLSPAEARVAVAISSGGTIAEVARQLGLSPNTVKTHLRHVFAKTGTGRQAELARLMATIGLVKGDGPANGI